ncbi:hypothetical protein DKM19_03140 [Streptosporangium sp. 'caverna']|nr:hypothetical protein DKM19_03140 [Streptosporangium sp. 'caverna']
MLITLEKLDQHRAMILVTFSDILYACADKFHIRSGGIADRGVVSIQIPITRGVRPLCRRALRVIEAACVGPTIAVLDRELTMKRDRRMIGLILRSVVDLCLSFRRSESNLQLTGRNLDFPLFKGARFTKERLGECQFIALL